MTETKYLNFEASPLQDLFFKWRCQDEPLLKKAASPTRNLTEFFMNDIDWRFGLNNKKNRKKNMIIALFGEPGTGKTNTMIYLSEYTALNANKDFEINDICFSKTELLLRMKDKLNLKQVMKTKSQKERIELTRGFAFALDEQKRGNFGVGSYREDQEVKSIVDIFRKLQTFNCFISPELSNMNICHYFLEAIGIDYENGYNKCILYNHRMKPQGHIITKLASEALWHEYEEKKDRFIEKTVEQKDNIKEVNMLDNAKRLCASPLYKIAKAKQEKQNIIRMTYPNLSVTENESLYYFTTLIERAKKNNLSIDDEIKKELK